MGTLYIVGTPIGNLADMPQRAVRVLQDVVLIAAEDTRKAHVLLKHYAIHTPVTSFFEGNERRKVAQVLASLASGDVALISDAGMPGISDPGYPLIHAAIEQEYDVVAIPGPSAHTVALVVSGLPTDRFFFQGFLPRKATERAAVLANLAPLHVTLILYEAPHRLSATLTAMREALGNRQLALCRELTKRFEEVWRSDLEAALAHVEAVAPRGEYTLVVAGASPEDAVWDEVRVREALDAHLTQGMSRSQAAREVAALCRWRKRDVYALR